MLCAVLQKEEREMTEDLLFHGKERKGMHFHSRKRSGKGTMGFVAALVCAVVFLVLCVCVCVCLRGACR